jgi:3-hydroxyisobutyrate dehydrogenase
MGAPLVRRLLGAGYPLIVWDTAAACRTPFEGMQGVRIAAPGEMARTCRAIFFVVPSSVEIASCLAGAHGILRHARRGLVLLDLTSSEPAQTRKAAKRAARHGVAYLDCAMSGGPAGIVDGTLTLMVGGDARTLARVRPYLDAFAKHVFHLGPPGAGQAMKLINNMVLHTTFVATCEGARLAQRMGMRVEDMIAVFNVSTAYSYASRHRFPNNILNGSWNGQARIYNPWKDVGIAVRLARQHGADVDLARRTLDFLDRAVARGLVDEDYTLLYRDFDAIRRTPLRGTSQGGRRRAVAGSGKKRASR